MFNTITQKAQEAKAAAGAAVATVKVLRQEYRETKYMVDLFYPDMTKKDRKTQTRAIFAFKVNNGLVHTN